MKYIEINEECWQLLEDASDAAPSQEVKDAIANVIDQPLRNSDIIRYERQHSPQSNHQID